MHHPIVPTKGPLFLIAGYAEHTEVAGHSPPPIESALPGRNVKEAVSLKEGVDDEQETRITAKKEEK